MTRTCDTCRCRVCDSVTDCQQTIMSRLASMQAESAQVRVDTRLLGAAAAVVIAHGGRFDAGWEQVLDAAVARLAAAMGMNER